MNKSAKPGSRTLCKSLLLATITMAAHLAAHAVTSMADPITPSCKANGFLFNTLIWDSSFSTALAANHKIKSLGQARHSSTELPISSCCSQTATANVVKMSCEINQKPIGTSELPKAAQDLCAEPNAMFIVGYSWTCTEPLSTALSHTTSHSQSE